MIGKKVLLASLVESAYNPRVIPKESDPWFISLKKSISEFSSTRGKDGYRLTAPIIVNKNGNRIIGGHQRIRALRSMGQNWIHKEDIVYVVIEPNSSREKTLNLALNKIGSGEDMWSPDRLADLLNEIRNDNMDMDITGFEGPEIDDILRSFIPQKVKKDIVPVAREESETKTGDIWNLGRHRIMCGDIREIEHVKSLMGTEKAQGIFTSPPYAEQRKEEYGGIPEEKYVTWWEKVQESSKWALKTNGSFFLNIKAHCKDGERVMYVIDLVLMMKRAWGWKYIDQLIWRKPGLPGGWNNRFRNDFEDIHWFGRDEGGNVYLNYIDADDKIEGEGTPFVDETNEVHHFSKTLKVKFHPRAVGKKSKQVPIYSKTSVSHHPITKNITVAPGRRDLRKIGIARPGNVIDITTNSEMLEHPAVYPVNLPAFFMKAFSDKNEIWLDPFMGSGTNIIAAEDTGRIGFGMEKDPRYIDVTIERWENYMGKKAKKEEE